MRTAFEFARALFALDPSGDPHGALLHLDYLAPKAGMQAWFLELWDFYASHDRDSESAWEGRMDPRGLPGWHFARALALRAKEEAEKKVRDRSLF